MILFNQKGWFYSPVAPMGWVVFILALATDVWFFIVIDRNSHSGSDSLIGFLPYFASVWVIFSWFASNTSTTKK